MDGEKIQILKVCTDVCSVTYSLICKYVLTDGDWVLSLKVCPVHSRLIEKYNSLPSEHKAFI